MVKPNLKWSPFLLQFRDSFGLKKAKIKKNSGLDRSFGSSNRFGLNVFGLTVLYSSSKPRLLGTQCMKVSGTAVFAATRPFDFSF